jgi:integrase
LTSRPGRHGANVVLIDSGSGLANATLQQRLVPVHLFFDYLIGEGVRQSNPVGRGRYTPGRRFCAQQRGLVPRLTKLPWIPTEPQWPALLTAFRGGPVRNRLMLALAYDAALRREELCSLRTDDLDPGRRMLRVRGRGRSQPAKHGLRPMRGLRTDRSAQVVINGHAFVLNLRRGHYEIATETPPRRCERRPGRSCGLDR